MLRLILKWYYGVNITIFIKIAESSSTPLYATVGFRPVLDETAGTIVQERLEA